MFHFRLQWLLYSMNLISECQKTRSRATLWLLVVPLWLKNNHHMRPFPSVGVKNPKLCEWTTTTWTLLGALHVDGQMLLCRLPPRGYCTLHLGILPLPGGLGTRRFEPLKDGSVDLCTIELLLSRGGSEVLKVTTFQKKNVSVFSIFMTIDTFCFPLLGWLAISNEMNCRVACVFGRLVLWKRRIPLWKQKLPVFGEFHTTWARFITNEPLGEGDVFHILSHSSWSESMKWLWFFKAETEVSRNLILNSATYRRFTHGPLRYRS